MNNNIINEEDEFPKEQSYNEQQLAVQFPRNEVFKVLNITHKDPRFHLNALKPNSYKDQLTVLSDPYQFLVCNVETKDCKRFSTQMIYAHLLYLMREWSFLSSSQVERVLAYRDSNLQCFQYNNLGKVTIIHKTRIITHNNTPAVSNGTDLEQRSLYVSENEDFYQFIAPSYKFSDILIASNRKSLHLIKQGIIKDKNVYGFSIIKEYNGFNAQIGRFSRDGKFFIFSNNISLKLYILDLFCHKIFERNTSQKSISHMSFSRSGLNFMTTCRETNTINVYECVLWEKQQFRFSSPIFFADFLDESQNIELANCIVVILQNGEVHIIKDMQFNMLNSAHKRINFDYLEKQSLVISQIPKEELPQQVLQFVFIDNILCMITQENDTCAFQILNLAFKDNRIFTLNTLTVHQNNRFTILPTQNQFIYALTVYNHNEEEDFSSKTRYYETVYFNSLDPTKVF